MTGVFVRRVGHRQTKSEDQVRTEKAAKAEACRPPDLGHPGSTTVRNRVWCPEAVRGTGRNQKVL